MKTLILLTMLAKESKVDLGSLPAVKNPGGSTVQLILGIVFGIAGALALLMITISAFRYIVSQGDSGTVAKAKAGIIYSLVGLVVCIAAESIVFFVIGKL